MLSCFMPIHNITLKLILKKEINIILFPSEYTYSLYSWMQILRPRSLRKTISSQISHTHQQCVSRIGTSSTWLVLFKETSVNFINVLRATFSYESLLCSFSLHVVAFWLCNFFAQKVLVKCWWNWHLYGSALICFRNQNKKVRLFEGAGIERKQ